MGGALRLRLGEFLAGAAAGVALVALFALHFTSLPIHGWWSYPPLSHSGAAHPPGTTGWHVITVLRWFVLASAALGLGAVAAQGLRRGPALAATLDLLAMLAAGLTTILLAIKLATTGLPLSAGAYVLVVAVAAIALGAYRAMRVEQGWQPGEDRPIEFVELHSRP